MGGAASGAKGASRERELVNRLRNDGFGALRLPSSGSSTERELPDILAGRPYAKGDEWTEHPSGIHELVKVAITSDLMAIELKSGAATTLYVEPEEVDALTEFCQRWGARGYLGARFTLNEGEHYSVTDTYLVRPEDARMTPSGRFGLPVDSIEERASVIVGPDGVTFVDGGGP